MKRVMIVLLSTLLLMGCALSKEERQNKRANKKLERLTNKYPQLLEKDTIIDTFEVYIPEIHIERIVETSKDVSGVDSILSRFKEELDSLTALKLGDEIKYYVTNRPILEDTVVHEEDGVVVKIWSEEGGLLAFDIFKPDTVIRDTIHVVHDVIRPAPEPPLWKQVLKQINQWAIPLFLLLALIWLVKKFIFKK